MNDATKLRIEPVRWMMASHPHKCCECGWQVLTGERFAHYVEVLSPNEFGKRRRIPHDYCVDCGHLLEDSLTTTEEI